MPVCHSLISPLHCRRRYGSPCQYYRRQGLPAHTELRLHIPSSASKAVAYIYAQRLIGCHRTLGHCSVWETDTNSILARLDDESGVLPTGMFRIGQQLGPNVV